MVMFLRVRSVLQNTQRAGHAKVYDQTALLKIQQQVFPPPFQAYKRLPLGLADLSGYRPAKSWVTDNDTRNPLTKKVRLYAPEGCFHFW